MLLPDNINGNNMKLKLTKPKTIIYPLLFGLVLLAGFMAINIPGTPAYAAMSFSQLKEKISSPMRNYCAPVRGDDYPKCTGTYTAGAAAVYNASSEKAVNTQLQTICTPPIQNWVLNGSASDCGAFVEGAGTAQDILGKPFYNGGGSQGGGSGGGGGGGGSQSGGGGGGSDQDKPPPITECNKVKGKENQRKCKQEYRACNPPPETRSFVPICKTRVINEYKNKGADEGGKKPDSEETDPAAIGEVGDYICGTYDDESKNVHTKFDFGCLGTQFAQTGQGQKNISPILDLAYAVIRFLSIGVGIVIAISVIMSGIQYSMSEGNAEVTQKAKSRIRSAILGLIIYVFTFAILQFMVPGGVFKPGLWLDENVLQLISRLNSWIF